MILVNKIGILAMGTFATASTGAVVSYLNRDTLIVKKETTPAKPYQIPDRYVNKYKSKENNFWSYNKDDSSANGKNTFFKL